MALVAWVMKHLPRNVVFCRNQGRAPAWSRWKWETSSRSILSASIMSTKGSASMPLRPGWMPQSNRIFFSLNSRMWQERPT